MFFLLSCTITENLKLSPHLKMVANIKKMADELKVLFAQEISASAVKENSSTNETLSRKLD